VSALRVPAPALVVRLPNYIGDVVLGLPALQLLRAHGLELELVGRRWAPALLAGESWRVHVQPARLRERVAQLRGLRRDAIERDPGFGLRENAIVLPNSFSSAAEMRLAGLRAVAYAWDGRSWLLARAEPPNFGGHALTTFWSLACNYLGLDARTHPPPASITLLTSAADQARADVLLARERLTPGRFVVVAPFAGGMFEKQDKRWPDFAQFTRVLCARGIDVVACPGPDEVAIAREQHSGVRTLEGVGLGPYSGVLRRAALMIGNDTGPAHLATAVGVPVISVLGPTKPEQWAPWGPNVTVIRHWPRWPRVDEVLARSEALLRGSES